MVKENSAQSFSSVISGWTKVTKERHSRAHLAQRRRMFLCGCSLTKISPGLFSRFGWCPQKLRNLITLGSSYPYGICYEMRMPSYIIMANLYTAICALCMSCMVIFDNFTCSWSKFVTFHLLFSLFSSFFS